MITGLLVSWPFIAAMLLLFIKGQNAKRAALAFSVIQLVVAAAAFVMFRSGGGKELFTVNLPWIASSGIRFHMALDGINILLVMLTSFLVPVILLASFIREHKNPSVFYSLVLFMQMALTGVFMAMDGFLFYIFWELALIPIYFICLLWGGENRARVTFKFFVYTLTGSLFMLIGLIYLYLQTPGSHSFDMNALYQAGRSLDATTQSWVFWAIFLAFAVKMPVFPFHTWQPDTYVTAPTTGTMLLSGIMLKMGTFGVIRWLMPVVPQGFYDNSKIVIILSVIGVIYASIIAIRQKDYKRLLAYSSIAHIGLISAGIFSLNVQGVQGSLIQMVSHGITVVGLFFIAEILMTRSGTRDVDALGGIRNTAPWFSVLFLIIMLGSVALPMTSGFVGEFLLISGIYQYSAWAAAAAGLTVILGAVYMLRSYQSIMLGEPNTGSMKFTGLMTCEKTVLIAISVLVIILGVYPKPMLDVSSAPVNQLVESVRSAIVF